jgi:peptide chain release factor 1
LKFSLDNIITEYESLETELMDPTIYADLARLKATNQKKKAIQLTVELYREYKMLYANYDELKSLVTDEKDPEMLDMMKSEIASADKRIPELEEAIKIALLPKDPNDNKNIMLEVRA